MPRNLKLSHKAWILVSIPLIFQLVFVATLAFLIKQAEYEAWREQRSKAVIQEAAKLHDLFWQQVMTLAAYGITRSDLLKERFEDNMAAIPRQIKLLKRIARQTPAQIEAVKTAENATNRALKIFFVVRNKLDVSPLLSGSRSIRQEVQACGDELIPALDKIADEERKLIVDPEAEARLRLFIQMFLLAMVVFNILLAFGLAIYFNRGTSRRLDVLVDNASRLARKDPLNPPLSDGDEIGRLDRTFHEMADALAEAARKERAVIDYAKDVIFSMDADGIFTAVSRAAISVWGYDPQELVGTRYAELVAPEDLDRSRSAMDGIRKLKTTTPFENQVRRKDGSAADMLWSVTWSDIEKSFFGIVHDITERKEIERVKQQFVGIVSHDLRSPLTSIQFSLNLLSAGASGEISDQARKDIHSAELNIDRLIRLINDLLDIEKMEAGKLEMNFELTPIASVFEQAAQSVAAVAEDKSIHIEIPKTDLAAEADSDRLIQVMVNLISNGLKFSPEKSTVTVTALETGGQLEVKVRDRGSGIAESFRKTIFDRFQQVSTDSKAVKRSGTGLGLAICKSIIEGHGGTIGVDSTEGEGSTFWFRIPLTQDDEVQGSTEPLTA